MKSTNAHVLTWTTQQRLAPLLALFVLLWMNRAAHAQTPEFVHDSHGDRIHDRESWDQVNGQRAKRSGSVGFLLRKGSRKHVSSLHLPREVIDLLGQNYVLEAPPDLDLEALVIKSGIANIRLGDFGDTNLGIGVRATVTVRIPDDLPPATRHIVLKFPNALRIRELTNAESPTTVPSITFNVTNFESEGARASARWWQYLIYGVLCLIGAALASIFAAGGDEAGCGALIVAIGFLVGALYLVGRAVGDLNIVNEQAFMLISVSFGIPLFILFFLIPDAWPIALGAAAILTLVALLSWWKGWSRIECGALVILPGVSLGTIVSGLRYALRSKKA